MEKLSKNHLTKFEIDSVKWVSVNIALKRNKKFEDLLVKSCILLIDNVCCLYILVQHGGFKWIYKRFPCQGMKF